MVLKNGVRRVFMEYYEPNEKLTFDLWVQNKHVCEKKCMCCVAFNTFLLSFYFWIMGLTDTEQFILRLY